MIQTKVNPILNLFKEIFLLLRWNKPSGRLILLIPSGWTLCLIPDFPPDFQIIALIVMGGISVSAVGCIANDIWDRNLDKNVLRTSQRPLARRSLKVSYAICLLFLFLILSLIIVLSLPSSSKNICIQLAFISLPIIFLYPSAKRWFQYPQAILSLCWGFAVLIPWAASESNLNGGLTLFTVWLSTIFWTFGFDTIYAMADENFDKKLGLKSSVLSLQGKAKKVVSIMYAFSSISIAIAAISVGTNFVFWPFWLLHSYGMQREVLILKGNNIPTSYFGRHFRNQVFLGFFLLIGLITGRIA
tara:strand:- start:140 stop:1042 length:903 start_codon:yes stop_codon:yes gene_type:complete